MEDRHGIWTERLLLRRWRTADRAPFAAMNADPAVMRHFPAPLDRRASDDLLDRIEAHHDAHGFGLWAVEVIATGEMVGFTGLNPMPPGVPGSGDLEAGWRLAAHAWHRGYATEAGRAALEVALGRLRLPRVWSITTVDNTPSRAVMARLGLVERAFFDHPGLPAGHPLRPHVACCTDPGVTQATSGKSGGTTQPGAVAGEGTPDE